MHSVLVLLEYYQRFIDIKVSHCVCISKYHDGKVYILIAVSSSESFDNYFMQILFLNFAIRGFILVRCQIRIFNFQAPQNVFLLEVSLERMA